MPTLKLFTSANIEFYRFMQITRLQILSIEMKLAEPYEIAYEKVHTCTNVFIRADTNIGITGFGCAAPDKMVTGETVDSVKECFYGLIEPVLLKSDPFRYIFLLDQLRGIMRESPSALAMADMLLFDLAGKAAGVPLYKYFGAYRESILTSITIGILPLDETLKRAGELIRQGYSVLKLKGGKNVDEDIRKIISLRENFGNNIEIRFDANQGYTLSDAVKFFKKTGNYNVELLEQPTPGENMELLGRVSSHVDIPVMADESITSLRDVFKLTRDDLTDMINIKLMKVGGINEAFQINAVAKAAKVESMIGCMDESGLAISAGLHVALSRPNIKYADLDGHLDLLNDPARNAVIIRKGVLYPTEKPGLGFDPDIF